MDTALALRHACRRLLRRPGWTTLVIATLALGIGANTAIFSVVDAVLLRPLPYPDPGRLVVLREASPISPMVPLTAAELEHLARGSSSLVAVEAMDPIAFHLAAAEGAERVAGALVTPGFFTLFGAAPQIGRLLSAEDAVASTGGAGGSMPVVLSHSYWRTRMGADPAVIGRELRMAWTAPFGPRRRLGDTFVVVGVLDSAFRSPFAVADVWAPLVMPEGPDYRDASYLFGFGRLKPAVGVDEARTELGTLLQGLGSEGLPSRAGPIEEMGVTVLPLAEQGIARVRSALWISFGAVGLVLLAACANAASLLLLWLDERRSELAVRRALGAGRARLAASHALDGSLLAAAGGVAGLGLAWAGVRWLHASRPGLVPREQDVSVDWRVASFAAAAAVLVTLLVAVVPAFSGTGARSRIEARRGSLRSRAVLMGAEVSVALMLLVGAGLLVRSFRTLERTDLGFEIDRVVTFEVALPSTRYPEPAQRAALLRSALERLRALPGVREAAVTSGLPLTPINTASPVVVNGREPADGQPAGVTFRFVGERYFEALGIALLAGRSFDAAEVATLPGDVRVVAVNRTFVARFLEGAEGSALGTSLRLGALDTPDLQVVAVVGDVLEFGPASPPRPTVYVPVASSASSGFVLRVDGEDAVEPIALFDDARAALAALDPEQPAHGFRAFDSAAERWLGTPAFQSSLMNLFAALALVLAGIGVFGSVGQAVRQRTREMGLRMALGAGRAQLLRALFGEVAVVVGIGATVGLGGALGLSRFLRGSLYGIEPGDPTSYAAALVLIGVTAAAAMALPACRALAVAPAEALRDS